MTDNRRMMSHSRRLSGRKIAVLAADGFEKVELVVPLRALQMSGADVDIVSLRKGRIRGVNLHMPATRVGVDKVVTDTDPDSYDGLLLPGGFINPDLLRQSAAARDFVRAFDHSAKPIATLCHGPWVLASAGLLTGRTLTSWPGIRDDLINAGATWLDREVVRDRNLITSRGPQDLRAFVPAMLDAFAAGATHLQTVPTPGASDPALDRPIGWAVAALRWSPKPSAAALVGAAGAALATPLRSRISIRKGV
jgi:protease I